MKPINLPPDDRRCTHHDEHGSRCQKWALAGAALCSKHHPGSAPTPPKNTSTARLEAMLNSLFLTQQRLALAIENSPDIDLKTLAGLSETLTGNALRITRTLKDQQALETAQQDISSLLDGALDAIAGEFDFDL